MCFRLSSSSSKLHPQGSFDENVCKSLHSINPYGSREGRIVFSTWNLDHRFTPPLVYLQDFFEGFFLLYILHTILQFVSRIEKKRTVIPALLEALQNHRSTDINLNYFYQLLFTRENLKLVHIVCHKKGAHNLQCDTKKIYNNATKDRKAKQKPKVKKRRMTWSPVTNEWTVICLMDLVNN